MEVKMKACCNDLREIWKLKANSHHLEMMLTHREEPIREKYGNDIFMEASERLRSQGEKRGEVISGWK